MFNRMKADLAIICFYEHWYACMCCIFVYFKYKRQNPVVYTERGVKVLYLSGEQWARKHCQSTLFLPSRTTYECKSNSDTSNSLYRVD